MRRSALWEDPHSSSESSSYPEHFVLSILKMVSYLILLVSMTPTQFVYIRYTELSEPYIQVLF
jgi:hypothetical protein